MTASLVVARRVGNLPVDVTSFVGRRRELADAKRRLSASRLLTLTGMGGVGKTRLALRVATEVHRGFADGVWLVELAGLHDPGLVAQTVAAALRLQDQSTNWSAAALADFLADRHLLLVLDNCEHLLDACAVLADGLLRGCREVRILATSRQPLGVAGEQILVVPSLSVPGLDPPASPESLEQFEAVTLFVERAGAVVPGFVIDADNQLAVAGICRRLDGIPLAVELAAGRLRVLSADQLLQRLDDRYGVLTGGSRAAMPRQQTLRALIDWSFELCSAGERLLWARLSVFAGGFELDAAEEICAGGGVAKGAVLDLLTALIDKSIVVAERPHGRVWYRLPDTLSEYGRERLAELGDAVEVQRRHRDWYRALVARAEAAWFGPEQVELFTRLRLEHANLRAALTFCLTESVDIESGLRMASELRFYWIITGRFAEGFRWLERLLAAGGEPHAVRLKALCVAGYLANLLNERSHADGLLREADLLARELADAAGSAHLTQIRGQVALFRGNPQQALGFLEEAVAVHVSLGDHAAAIYDRVQLAIAAAQLGQHQRSVALLEDCITAYESSEERWLGGLALWALGIEACEQGDYGRAIATQRQSIRLRLPLEDRLNISFNIQVLAWAAAGIGDSALAARLFGAAKANAEATGFRAAMPRYMSELHDRLAAIARKDIGDAAFDKAFRDASRLDFHDAVELALGDRRSTPVPRTAARSASEPGSLTPREREIANLIMRGLSNKDIASKLVISPRTAEGHVEHILTKLGFTARSQIAAWAARDASNSGHD